MARPAGIVVDTHLHLFAGEDKRFPYAKNAPYRPEALTLETYARFAAEAKIDHAVIVHPEPYQDDHRYLEYCFANEPSRGFFKGTCLFDPIAPETPGRMEALVKRHPGRIVAIRIHETRKCGEAPTVSGAIRDRDLRHPGMNAVWKKAQSLGLAIQMHFVPCHAPLIGALAGQFPNLTVILDHLGRAGQGTPGEYAAVLKLAALPRVYMKHSGVAYSSKQQWPHPDVAPLVRSVYDAFGPGRIIWGGLGHTLAEFERQAELLDRLFGFAPEAERAAIRGANAARLFGW
jgi:predicted TIM-barrel fold metal-dependent hydrolase